VAAAARGVLRQAATVPSLSSTLRIAGFVNQRRCVTAGCGSALASAAAHCLSMPGGAAGRAARHAADSQQPRARSQPGVPPARGDAVLMC
jgi:hypothetical protein